MNINKFIDWNAMFKYCMDECKDFMISKIEQHLYSKDQTGESQIYWEILNFYNDGKISIPIDLQESEITDDEIIFVFTEIYNTANESDNTNSYFSISIIYDMRDDMFIDYYTEQG